MKTARVGGQTLAVCFAILGAIPAVTGAVLPFNSKNGWSDFPR